MLQPPVGPKTGPHAQHRKSKPPSQRRNTVSRRRASLLQQFKLLQPFGHFSISAWQLDHQHLMLARCERRASTDSVSKVSTELEFQSSLSPMGPGFAPALLGGGTLESVPETPPEAALFNSGGSIAVAFETTQRRATAVAESALWGHPAAMVTAAGEGATRSEGGAKGGETREVHRPEAQPRATHTRLLSAPLAP